MSDFPIDFVQSERRMCSDGRMWYRCVYRVNGKTVQGAATANTSMEAIAVAKKSASKQAKVILGLPPETLLEEFDEYELPF